MIDHLRSDFLQLFFGKVSDLANFITYNVECLRDEVISVNA